MPLVLSALFTVDKVTVRMQDHATDQEPERAPRTRQGACRTLRRPQQRRCHRRSGGGSAGTVHLWACGIFVCLRRHLRLGSGPSHGLHPIWYDNGPIQRVERR